jgi:hypothetical protein
MAPEQLRGQASPAADLYGLGAALVALLTATDPAQLPHERLRIQFRALAQISDPLARWLERLLEPAPEDRFPSARAALEALDALERPVERAPSGPFLPPAEPAPLAFPPPPLGSHIDVAEGAVVLPSPGLRGLTGQKVFMMFFAGFWLSFVTVWTAGAAMGSPFFALFSIPFWLVGFGMVAGVFKSLVAGERLTMDRAQWTLERRILGFTWQTIKGAVADINHVDIGESLPLPGREGAGVRVRQDLQRDLRLRPRRTPERAGAALAPWPGCRPRSTWARAARSRPGASVQERATQAVNAPGPGAALSGGRVAEAQEDGLGVEPDAEALVDRRLDLRRQRQQRGRVGAPAVDQREAVLAGEPYPVRNKALTESGLFDEPGGGELDALGVVPARGARAPRARGRGPRPGRPSASERIGFVKNEPALRWLGSSGS